MRKITYIIDDEAGFKKSLKKEKMEMLNPSFKVKYTLMKDSTGISYKLADFENNPININTLNGYQSMYTNECFNAFTKDRDITSEYKDFIKIDERSIQNEHELDFELERE